MAEDHLTYSGSGEKLRETSIAAMDNSKKRDYVNHVLYSNDTLRKSNTKMAG